MTNADTAADNSQDSGADPAAAESDDTEATPVDVEPTEGTAEASDAVEDPDEVLKQKYREAMAHKHGAPGAAKAGHGDSGSFGHSQSAGPMHRMFRRKSGG